MKVYIITYNVNRRFWEAGRGGVGRPDAVPPDSQNFFLFFYFSVRPRHFLVTFRYFHSTKAMVTY